MRKNLVVFLVALLAVCFSSVAFAAKKSPLEDKKFLAKMTENAAYLAHFEGEKIFHISTSQIEDVYINGDQGVKITNYGNWYKIRGMTARDIVVNCVIVLKVKGGDTYEANVDITVRTYDNHGKATGEIISPPYLVGKDINYNPRD